jgi:hypothetical protein
MTFSKTNAAMAANAAILGPSVMPGGKRVIMDSIGDRPINFRTVPCRNFHSSEGCTRGDNCHFVHDFNYIGKPITNLSDWMSQNKVRQESLDKMNRMMQGYQEEFVPAGPVPHPVPDHMKAADKDFN